jgi:hypothetical protein
MKRWEYRTVFESQIERMGDEGWECFCVTEFRPPYTGSVTRLYHVRREKGEEKEQENK